MEATTVLVHRGMDQKTWCTYTVEYYSVMKTEISPFAATWVDLDTIILSEVRQKKTNNDITHVESKK